MQTGILGHVVATLLLCSAVLAQDACRTAVPVDANGGVIASSNPYANNAKCRWTVSAQPGKVINLDFLQVSLESSTNCAYDRVVVYDSDAVDTVLARSACDASLANLRKLGTFCGSSTPSQEIKSSGSRVVVELCTDSSQTGAGFQIQLTEETGNAAPDTGNDCDVDFIVDGKQWVTYYNNAGLASFRNCKYTLTSKSGRPLKVNTGRFDMEGVTGCPYDFVAVREGDIQLGRFCGKNPPVNVRSAGSVINVEFQTDEYVHGKGFALLVEESCPGTHLCNKVSNDEADQCYEEADTCNGQPQCSNGQDESACDGCGSPTWDVSKPWPGAAAITHIDGLIQCGGALINKNHVLTAAHCFHRLDNRPDRFVVKMGTARLDSAQVFQIKSITNHPLFNPKTLANNLAIVELATPAPLQKTISPFCVPANDGQGTVPTGTTCYTLGWGRTKPEDKDSYSASVKNLTATILANTQCRFSSSSPVVVGETNICASTSGKLCYGDTGAPLVCRGSNGRYQVVGINSVAFGCSSISNINSSFTKVQSYFSWISETAF